MERMLFSFVTSLIAFVLNLSTAIKYRLNVKKASKHRLKQYRNEFQLFGKLLYIFF